MLGAPRLRTPGRLPFPSVGFFSCGLKWPLVRAINKAVFTMHRPWRRRWRGLRRSSWSELALALVPTLANFLRMDIPLPRAAARRLGDAHCHSRGGEVPTHQPHTASPALSPIKTNVTRSCQRMKPSTTRRGRPSRLRESCFPDPVLDDSGHTAQPGAPTGAGPPTGLERAEGHPCPRRDRQERDLGAPALPGGPAG